MILIDTNIVSETFKPEPEPLVLEWLIRHDAELALPAVVVAELSYGIQRISPEQRSRRLARGLSRWLDRFADRLVPFDQVSALTYGEIMGEASRRGRPMSIPDGMIAATAKVRSAPLATRNVSDFRDAGIDLINPWQPASVQDSTK